MRIRTFASAVTLLATLAPATLAVEPTASAATCKARAKDATHVYTYQGKGAGGYWMIERRNTPLKYGECIETLGSHLEGRFQYHDNNGTGNDTSYYYKWPTGDYEYFYHLKKTEKKDYSHNDPALYVRGGEFTWVK